MSVYIKKEHPDFQFAVWRMDEELDELLMQTKLQGKDQRKVESFIHEARKKEWICIRLLLKMMGHDFSIAYDANGKPFPENAPAHVSISHTRDFAGIMVSEKYPVGIDFERIHPRIEKIVHKFVSKKEEEFLPRDNRLETLFVIWGIKEVLYKIHGIGDLLFKEDIAVDPFVFEQSGEVSAQITKKGFNKTYRLFYELRDDLLTTGCCVRDTETEKRLIGNS